MRPSKNPIYSGNRIWGKTPEWLNKYKSRLDKERDKDINYISVFKEVSGVWRWVTFSSSAFQDQDNEIVSTKALREDVLRADIDGEYGPLRWWHVKNANLGICDFNMMYGHVLIESGTFYNGMVAQAIKDASHELGVSIGFYHPISDPDREGVFHKIKRFERSLLPKGIASNPLTALVVQTTKE